MDKKYDPLKLENQLCFPLYACSREIIKKYRPLLEKLDLTYTQYIAMMVLWEQRKLSVKELGKKLYLDSGTLTPVLKSLEAKGFVSRNRSTEDERVLMVEITKKGDALKEKAISVPQELGKCIVLSPDEAACLYKILYKLLDGSENGQ
ncbi:MarR family winged helix-turn-helix transcriptional regulator [Ruminococcus sp. XPD3002]|uniref:MarR family winged helix-turn-helix transcriptional regulator n=1 Tax=Ruminococcus sp. XPD3002 TaxID=1452269 RepID=UPI00090F527D|nr:MarR family transcriptional regulator [Ruminococcus sp.]SFX98766.1 DNA-binding transcriptional regulator, MarR family [Ruminococcus flavefaciens]HPY86112.1 MarR family transcriptional regulator [Ruminococcus flavefaciens]